MKTTDKMNDGLVKLTFTIIGIVLGAGFTFLSDFFITEKEYLEQAKYDAYVDYLDSHAMEYVTRDSVDEKWNIRRDEWRRKAMFAMKEIAICGNEEVVKKLAYYFTEHYRKACSTDKQQLLDDIATFRSMRQDLVGKDNVTDAELIKLIVGCDIE